MAAKTYPVSINQTQHNIDFYITRNGNLAYEARERGDHATAERLEKQVERGQELFLMVLGAGGTVWLPGKVVGEIKEIVAWANETRADTQTQRQKNASY